MSALVPALACVLALACLVIVLARPARPSVGAQVERLQAMSRHPSSSPAQAFGMRLHAYALTRAAGRTGQEPRR